VMPGGIATTHYDFHLSPASFSSEPLLMSFGDTVKKC